jgi:hypothetical protein
MEKRIALHTRCDYCGSPGVIELTTSTYIHAHTHTIHIHMYVYLSENSFTALKDVLARHARKVHKAALGCSSDDRCTNGWTQAQLAEAALLLLNSNNPQNAVPESDMTAALGRHLTCSTQCTEQQKVGQTVLQALVQARVLYLRPVSHWAVDMPHSVHQAASCCDGMLVTARYAAELYCMAEMREQLQNILDYWHR